MAQICKYLKLKVINRIFVALSYIPYLVSFQNSLLFLCLAVALLTVSSMLIHYINLPIPLHEALTEDSLHFLYIAGVSRVPYI